MEKKYKRYEAIYRDLLEGIKNGRLQNGDRLPTEFQLMERYGVSRITARTAVQLLERDGLIRRERRNGSFVSISPQKQLTIPLALPYNEYINYGIVEGAQQLGAELGCRVPLYNTHNRAETEAEILAALLETGCDGILLYPCSQLANVDLVTRLRARRIPLAFLDREILGTDCPLITSNNGKAMFELVTRLISAGYRRIGYFGIRNNALNSAERARFTGYCLALTQRGGVDKSYLYELPEGETYWYADPGGTLLPEAARRAVAAFPKGRPPQAVCCVNDYAALCLMDALKMAGYSLPEDISVIGFDDIGLSRESSPPLATVGQDFFRLGRTALDAVVKAISGQQVARRLLVDTKLILRESLAKRPAAR